MFSQPTPRGGIQSSTRYAQEHACPPVAFISPDYIEVLSGGEDLVLPAGEACDHVLGPQEVPPGPIPCVEVLADKRPRHNLRLGNG